MLPSRLFRAEFAKRGLAPTNLSRPAADSGHLAAGATELLRGIHGGRTGIADPPLPAVLLLQRREPLLFVMSRREQGRQLFSPRELVISAISVIGAIVGIIAIATGWITI